jgi:hypothetical protein
LLKPSKEFIKTVRLNWLSSHRLRAIASKFSSQFPDASTVDPAKLRQLIDQLKTFTGLQQGFEELNAGQTRSIAQFSEEMQQKYGISD